MQNDDTKTLADIWLPRCNQFLDDWGKKHKFVESVRNQILADPVNLPSDGQVCFLKIVYWSEWKKQRSDVEKDVAALYGLK